MTTVCKRLQTCKIKWTHQSPVAVASTQLFTLSITEEIVVGVGVGVVQWMKCYRDSSMTTGDPNLFFHVDLAGYCWFFWGTNWGSGTTGEGLSFLVVDEQKSLAHEYSNWLEGSKASPWTYECKGRRICQLHIGIWYVMYGTMGLVVHERHLKKPSVSRFWLKWYVCPCEWLAVGGLVTYIVQSWLRVLKRLGYLKDGILNGNTNIFKASPFTRKHRSLVPVWVDAKATIKLQREEWSFACGGSHTSEEGQFWNGAWWGQGKG